ncbi:MAG: hypothetical protein ABUL46_05660, partial [Chitinophaga rupis]
LMDEKASRTPAQKKISSNILYAIKMDLGLRITPEVATLRTGVVKDAQGKIKVDINADVTPKLLNDLRALGGDIIFSSEKFRNIIAIIPLNKIEEAASFDAIKHIELWVAPFNNGGFSDPRNGGSGNDGIKDNHILIKNDGIGLASRMATIGKKLFNALDKIDNDKKHFFLGSVTSEADKTHKADLARAVFGINGSGVKIGVLSNGVDGYASSQASGDLPPVINILPGQAGTGSEGRAMMELIYDLAPGADLYYATGTTGFAIMAQNILNLRAAGCDIIVDDIGYFAEGVFQDDLVAQAVNTITASGGLYFSSA